MLLHRSAERVVAFPDLAAKRAGELAEDAWCAMDLAQQVIKQVAISQVSQDLFILVTHPVNVVRMSAKLIQMFK